MLCFKNLVSLATFTSTGATAINLTQAGTLKRAYKDGACTLTAAGLKTLRAVFGSTQSVSVIAWLGATCSVDGDELYGFYCPATGDLKEIEQNFRLRAHQTETICAVFPQLINPATTFDLNCPGTAQNVTMRQLWIGDGIRSLPGINMQRVSLGGAEIVQPSSGAIFTAVRPSWRKYSVTLPAVTDAQWGDAGGLLELESLGNGTEALLMPGGVSSDAARVGLLAIHGSITNFGSQQIKRGLRAVTFDVTECR